jgi:nicotinamide phosphoribosyltransferase
MKFSPILLADFYKLSHPPQYPPKTEVVYSNTTARSSRMEDVNEVIVFGFQYLIEEYIVRNWNENFFHQPKDKVISAFKRLCDKTLGPDSVDESLFADLHDLGYLPLHIKTLPEGTRCPVQIPMMTIKNTDKRFFWLTNFVETLTQTVVWQAITSATIADQYKKLLTKFAGLTSSYPEFVQWQGHDFSMRGMSSVESGAISGAAHLLSFAGTDTITAIQFLEEYYSADLDTELVGGSVPATEHAVCCSHLGITEPKEIVEIFNENTNEWEFKEFVF